MAPSELSALSGQLSALSYIQILIATLDLLAES
jgi:hypothetical protein